MTAEYSDEYWMARALQLARLGETTTTPNPNVGCVIVKNNQLVGEGYHKKAGTPHAEVHALAAAGNAAHGATAYVTLEPCSHFGKTPPCADALIAAGVARVVCAMTDPNPLVAGKGLAKLQAAGIAASAGILEADAEALNRGFLQRMRTGRPFITVKMASSLDGATALANGESQWITGPEARADVQQWRARSCAIVTGVGTVLADNPKLNVRLPDCTRQPARIILDPSGRTPLDANITQGDGNTILIHSPALAAERIQAYQQHGFLTQVLPLKGDGIDLKAFADWAGTQSYNHLWVEAGATLAGAFAASGLVNRFILYQAAKFLGANTRPLLGLDLSALNEAIELKAQDVRFIGQDIRWILAVNA